MYNVLLLAVVCLNVHSYGDNMCKVPNGDAGRCVNIQRCKPLWDIYNKKRKTQAEDMFIRQSFCGYRNSPTINVCCPSIVAWHNFEANPVAFHNPLDDLSGDTYYPTTQVNVTEETKADNIAEKTTDISNTNPTQSGESPLPVTTTTDTEPKINEVIPLSRDSSNVTDYMSSSSEDDVLQSLSISNRNDNMTCGYSDRGNRITGGDETGIDEYPWLVLLEYSSGALGCGGSLITSRFVLTAAHCANSRVNGIPAFVRLSEYNTTSFPTDIVETDGGGLDVINVTVVPVEKVWPHPNYTYISFLMDSSTPNAYDIGLVKLTRDVEFNDFIKIICLPNEDFISDFDEGLHLSVAGWGEDKIDTRDNDVKKAVTIPYVPLDKCRTLHSRALVDSQICAGGEKDKDSCIGDSGGPLMYENSDKFYLVGIVSYGSVYCGTKGQPGIYTNVYKYLKWISDVVNGKE